MIEKFKLCCYYAFGITVGKLCYPKALFTSQYFSRPGSKGWKWLYHAFWDQKIRGINRHCPWPCSPGILFSDGRNIDFDVNDLNNFFSNGIYFQDIGKIVIGSGTFIGPNVGLITENHDIVDPAKRGGVKSVIIGEKCWIGMNSVILPGVELGDHTVVGAGSIVTKSFPEGYCVIAGNPARIIKNIKI